MKLIFLGPPGAGKGTHATRIAKMLGIAHISTGDMLRSEIQGGTALGKEAKAYTDRGSLVPDDVILAMVKERITMDDCESGFLFDGFPRTIAQAEALSQICDIDRVVNIRSSAETIIKRLCGRRMCDKCGKVYNVSSYTRDECDCLGKLYQRDDDKPEIIENRLHVYDAQSHPLIAYYAERGLLTDVDGDGEIEPVFTRILGVLE